MLSKYLLLFLISPLISSTAFPQTLFSPCTPPARRNGAISNKFCAFPPTVPVDLDVYQGTWFLIYNSGSAQTFSADRCITADYTLLPNKTVAVLNCAIVPKNPRPQCVMGVATDRPGTNASGKLQVAFPTIPQSPANPGGYNVAALLGNQRTGYLAAAVFLCTKIPGRGNVGGFFVLSRTLKFRRTILFLLEKKLKCSGYDTSMPFLKTGHSKKCNYFFEKSGFDVMTLPPFESSFSG